MSLKLVGITVLFAVIVGFAAGWKVNSWRMGSSYVAEKAEVIKTGADALKANVQNVNDAGNQHVNDSLHLKTQIATLKKELKDVQKTKPVPADCKPDADRLRIITAAVDATNRAASGQ